MPCLFPAPLSLSVARRKLFLSVIQPDFEYAASTFILTMSAANHEGMLTLWRAIRNWTFAAATERHPSLTSLDMPVCGDNLQMLC